MITPDRLSIFLKEQAWPIGIIAAFLIFTFVVLTISARSRQRKLVAERASVTEESFTRHLERYGFDPVIAASTYRYLQDVQLVQIPILPTDKLDEDLGLDTEDLDQTLHDLSYALGRQDMPGMRHDPLVTVEQLIRYLQASPRALRKQDVA